MILFWILAVVLVGAWSWVLVQYFSLRRANVDLADRYADTVRQLDRADDHIIHLEHEYNPDVTDARTAQYVKVLDVVRQNINLDARTTGTEGGMMLGGKPWADPGGDNQGLSQLARGGTAGAVEINRRVERVHDAMKNLAAFFGEEDPCPCSRCTVNRAMKERGMPATMSELMAVGQIPKMPDIEPATDEPGGEPPPRHGKFDLPTPIDPNKLRGDL